MTLSEKVIELHERLEAAGIPHAFGGALALAYYTLDPRGTSDIDLNIFVPEAHPEEALAALPDGITDPHAALDEIKTSGQARLWWNETPIDLFFDNVELHKAARFNTQSMPFSVTEIPILGPVELAAFKALFNRTRDWADLEAMVAAGKFSVEEAALAVAGIAGDDDPRVARLLSLVAT